MSTQVTVRRADDSVQWAEQVVAEGTSISRAQYLDWLVQRDKMLRRSLADLETIALVGSRTRSSRA